MMIQTRGWKPVIRPDAVAKILEQKGAFQIKGLVGQVALRLGVSNFTIYNYLKKIRATQGTAIKDIL